MIESRYMPDQSGHELQRRQHIPPIETPKLSNNEVEPIPFDIVVLANRALEPGKSGGLVNAMLQFSDTNAYANVTSVGWDGKLSTPLDIKKWKQDIEHWKIRKNRRDAQSEMEGPQEVFDLIKPNGKISTGPILMTADELKAHYENVSNNLLWPTFHSQTKNIHGKLNYDDWVIHEQINDRMADYYVDYASHHPAKKRDAWVHDYHLMLLPQKLRDKGVADPIGHFSHIPFPKPEVFKEIPEKIEKEGSPSRYPRQEILEGLLGSDVIGFQSSLDASNFLRNVDEYLGGIDKKDLEVLSRPDPDHPATGNQPEGVIIEGYILTWKGRKVKIVAYPIGVDAESLRSRLDTPEVQASIRKTEEKYKDNIVIADVSRLDPSKGILAQMKAYRVLLDRLHEGNPAITKKINEVFKMSPQELLQKLKFVRIVAPSRENVPAYAKLRDEMLKEVTEINEHFRSLGYDDKIELRYENVPNNEVLALLEAKTTRVAMTTPYIDGMNLVVKEAAATRNKNLRFVVGKGAGVSNEIKGMAFRPQITNEPEDINTLAMNLFGALTLPDTIAEKWKEYLDRQVTENGVGKWGSNFVNDLHKMNATQ